jgi:SAM-dependent methyltransferase
MSRHEAELDRIRSAYRERDSARPAPTGWSWGDPAYRFYMQQLEWATLEAIACSGAPLPGGRALEVGCGSGYFLQRLKDYGAAHAAGIDLMDNRIEQARARYPTLELVSGDASGLPWDDASFDLVTQFTCLSSILDPALRTRIADEMWRVVAPGGAIVSYDMLPTPRVMRLARSLRRRGSHVSEQGGGTATTPIDLEEVRRLFPHGTLRTRSLMLDAGLAGLAGRSRVITQTIAAVPFLNTHLLATVTKP